MQSFRIQLQKKFANIWPIKQDGISAINKAAQIHSLSDVFVDVADAEYVHGIQCKLFFSSNGRTTLLLLF